MIISASRRTDIPAYYSEWLFRRLAEGYALVRNPVNPHMVSRVPLDQDAVDGIVLWTKNPIPMLGRLGELGSYPYYFQFTLTPYGKDIEPGLPPKVELMSAFRTLSGLAGRERVVWRYDPILLSGKYTAEYHVRRFRDMASKLSGYADRCTISFLDWYRKASRGLRDIGAVRESAGQREELVARMAEIAAEYGFTLDACAEEDDWSDYGVRPAHCIDRERLEAIGGRGIRPGKDRNQRPACGCVPSVDIGAYDSCPNGCRYCYANAGTEDVMRRHRSHDPASPLLIGEVGPLDRQHILHWEH